MNMIEDYRGEIFLNYIVKGKKLKEVIAEIEAKHNVHFS